MLRRSLCLLFLASALPGSVRTAAALPPPRYAAWASATVPVEEPVYQELDRLDAMGYLPDAILMQRPMSRGEIAGLIDAASKRPDAVDDAVRDLLIRLRREYPVYRIGEAQGMQSLTVGAAKTDQGAEPIPPENGVGRIQGMAAPLTAYHEGDPYARGGAFWLKTYHTYNTSPALALGFRADFRMLAGSTAHEALQPVSGPRAVPLPYTPADDTRTAGDFNVKALYGRLNLGPLVLEGGRDAIAWGPLPRGGLHVSTNARPLDMLLVTSGTPYRLPWLLRYMGPHRGTIFVSALGADRTLANAFLLGIKASFRPHRLAEIGFTETLVIGGEGAPKPTGYELLRQILPIGGLGPGTDYSDHRFGADFRIQVWPRRLVFYQEFLFEDARNGYWTDVTASRSGLFAPAVGPGARFEARLEYTRLPAVLYRHGRWTTGYTVDGRILGEELGPDADGFRTELRWNRANGDRVTLEAAAERRDADWWDQVPRPTPPADPGDAGDIFRVIDLPTEHRVRLDLTGEFHMDRTTSWRPRVAAERIRDVRFTQGTHAVNYIVELALDLHFGRNEQRPGITVK